MWKRNAISLALTCAVSALALAFAGAARTAWSAAQQPSQLSPKAGLPPGAMQEKAEKACLGCHSAAIIVQQQLNAKMWGKEIDKMGRWGAPVAAEDREALIEYFTKNFGTRDPAAEVPLPDGPGVDKVRAACSACHDAGNIMKEGRDLRGWTRIVNKMVSWGAEVPDEDRDAILNYLVTHFPRTESGAKKDEKQP